MAAEAGTSSVIELLMLNLTQEIPIILEKDNENQWGKSLVGFPHFTIKEIEKYRVKTGKGNAIIKTRDRGCKFMDERDIFPQMKFSR